jgi:pimeloyl-ACP methyl ester carboxylesterase
MIYVLVPGAGGDAWYWHRVEQELDRRGRAAVSVKLPTDDESAGLAEYTEAVIRAIPDHADVVLVAQSMGGFTVPLVAQRRPVAGIVLVNAMIPQPGETAGDWWGNTAQAEARRANDLREGRSPDADFDLATYFFHDVPADIAEYGLGNGKRQADRPFGDPCVFTEWPAVPIHVISGRDDRFFPLEFQQRVARERLNLEPDAVPGGHLVALSRPTQLVDQIESYRLGR